MELDRDTVTKALKWCSELRLCVDCPMRAEGYFSHSGNACRKALMENALALINELAEENERLRDKLERTDKALIVMDKAHKKLFTESFKIEADTVRKMHERLKAVAYQSNDWSHGEHPMVVEVEDIDQIAKEMLEVSNE